MSKFEKFRPGDQIAMRADTINAVLDTAKAAQKAAGSAQTKHSDGIPLPGLQQRAYGTSISTDYQSALAPLRVVGVLNSATEGFEYSPTIDVVDYPAGWAYDAWSLVNRATPSKISTIGNITTAGIIIADVDVTDAAHAFCDVPATHTPNYVSDWDGPHRILWRATDAGTGVMRCLIRLGEQRARVLYGRARANWKKQSGIPSVSGAWGYVEVDLMYPLRSNSTSNFIKVLLPTNRDQDPNVEQGQIIPFVKIYTRTKASENPLSGEMSAEYCWMAIGSSYASEMIGTTRMMLVNSGWTPPRGWAKVDGTQTTSKTKSGLAVNAGDRFARFNKNANQTGGTDHIEITGDEVAEIIENHPGHTHGIAYGTPGTPLGVGAGYQPTTNANSAQVHAGKGDGYSIYRDILPPWQGFTLIERVDNSA